jgi:hypothetical protein
MSHRRLHVLAALLGCGFSAWSVLAAPADATNTGHPADHLPPHIKRLTWLGERPDWRHDGQRFVFVSKVFGDVLEYEMASGRIYSLSDHFRHHGFTRAQYLSNGDILLVGPSATFDRTDTADRKRARHDIGLLQLLRRPFNQPPVSLGVEADEGPAVSRRRMRVAWTHGAQDQISIGDITYEPAGPKLANVRKVLDASKFPEPVRMLETQNFIPPDDDRITVCGYQVNRTNNTDTFVLHLATGRLENMGRSPDTYDEPEGIFPDGRFTAIEHGSSLKSPWPRLDIYKLALDGSGKLQRLTHFTAFAGWKATQPVVSDDGRWMLFQIGKSGDEAGQGYGIFLYDLTQALKP